MKAPQPDDEPTLDELLDLLQSNTSPLISFNRQRIRDYFARREEVAVLAGQQQLATDLMAALDKRWPTPTSGHNTVWEELRKLVPGATLQAEQVKLNRRDGEK